MKRGDDRPLPARRLDVVAARARRSGWCCAPRPRRRRAGSRGRRSRAASGGAIAAWVGSPASATSRAAPAVSPATISGLRPSSRMTLRHWPSACTWLCTVLIVSRLGAGRRHQRELDAQEVLADDVQVGGRAGSGGCRRPGRLASCRSGSSPRPRAGLHRGEGVLERSAGHGHPVGRHFQRRAVRKMAPGAPENATARAGSPAAAACMALTIARAGAGNAEVKLSIFSRA